MGAQVAITMRRVRDRPARVRVGVDEARKHGLLPRVNLSNARRVN